MMRQRQLPPLSEISLRELRALEYATTYSFDVAIGIPKPGHCTEPKRREYQVQYILRSIFPDMLIEKGDKSYDGKYASSEHRIEIKTGLKPRWVIHRQNLDDLKDWFLAIYDREAGWPVRIYRMTGYTLGKFYKLVSEKIWEEDHRMRPKPRRKGGYTTITEKLLLEWFSQDELELYDGGGNRIY
jgi:hypothetical protein